MVLEDIEDVGGDAGGERATVLGEEEDAAEALVADLFDKVVEGDGVGQVKVGAGFEAVAVATGYDGEGPGVGHVDDAAVFRPGAESVEFQGVDEALVAGEESLGHRAVGGFAESGLVPEGVIQYDEDSGELVQPGEEGGRMISVREDFDSARGRKVVDAEMEKRARDGDGEFNGVDGGT